MELTLASKNKIYFCVAGAEAFQPCTSRSKLFRGPCKSSKKCAVTCQREHFAGGYCLHKAVVGDQHNEDDDDLFKLRRDVYSCMCKCNYKKGNIPPPPPETMPPPPQPKVMPMRKVYGGMGNRLSG